MKKVTAILLVVLMLVVQLPLTYAEPTVEGTTVFEENFDNGFSSWTTFDEDGDGNNWLRASEYSPLPTMYEGSDMALSVSEEAAPDNQLTSPKITTLTNTLLTLKWAEISLSAEKLDNYSVYVFDTAEGANNENSLVYSGKASATFELKEVDISAFAGKEIQIQFRHHDSQNNKAIAIDSVSVIAVKNEPEVIAVTGIELNVTEAQLPTGGTLELNAKVLPEGATNKTVIWTSSDETLATVNVDNENTSKCTVKSLKDGTVTITAETEDGGFTATCTIEMNVRYLLYEDFEDALIGWKTVDSDGDGNGWVLTGHENISYEGEGAIASYSYTNDPGKPLTPDNWLISPSFMADKTAMLSWYVGSQDPQFINENYSVYVLPVNYTSLNQATKIFNGKSTAEWVHSTASLDRFVGQSVRIAFRHHDSTDKFMIDIDLITITSTEIPIPPAFIPGDANFDNVVNSADAVVVLRHAAGMANASFLEAAADMTGDGTVNTGDAVAILKSLVA